MDILKIIKGTFSSENYTSADVEMDDNNKKSVHVGSNLVFAKVKTVDKEGKIEDIYLAVKVGKHKLPHDGHRESFFFDTVMPAFKNLQKELKPTNPFDKVPKCYRTLSNDGYEIVLLENLKHKGYEPPKTEIINKKGQELILTNLAKFHALSFALRHLDRKKFDDVTKNLNMIIRPFIANLTDVFHVVLEKIKTSLISLKMLDTLTKFDKLMEKWNADSVLKILDEKPEEIVIVHGDFHKFNMMYKYEAEDSEDITDLLLIDFQVLGLHSPVLDLSYYFYYSLVFNLDETSYFLKFYHKELGLFLREMGCNVEEIFPYSKLLEHWEKYSFYAFCFIISLVKMDYIKDPDVTSGGKDENTGIEQLQEGKSLGDSIKEKLINRKVNDDEEYMTRLAKLTKCYVDYGVNIQ